MASVTERVWLDEKFLWHGRAECLLEKTKMKLGTQFVKNEVFQGRTNNEASSMTGFVNNRRCSSHF